MIEGAEEYLLKVEPRFADVIAKHGPCSLVRVDRGVDVYESLMSAILFQQLSGKAATAIQNKLYALFPDDKIPPRDGLLKMSVEDFRAVGVSRQKAGYLLDLAEKAGDFPTPEEVKAMPDEEIIAKLTPVKGIGVWSVQMLLMFTLGRPDVMPIDDLGVQEGAKRLLELETRPKPKELLALAEPWKPYRSVAAWYLWRLLEP